MRDYMGFLGSNRVVVVNKGEEVEKMVTFFLLCKVERMRGEGAFLFILGDTNDLIKVGVLGASFRDILDGVLDAEQLMSILRTIPRLLHQLSFAVLEVDLVKLEGLVLGQLGDGITLCIDVNKYSCK